MKAIVTREFMGRPDSDVLARPILVGEEITGELAAAAVGANLATPAADELPAVIRPKRGRK